jgi:uncharacterized protein YndB with AHSA1/START domain
MESSPGETERRSVRRETVLEVDPETAWEAISDERMLERWLAEEVELEPIEGAPARFVVDGEERTGEVRDVSDGAGLSFTWAVAGRSPTLVELTLSPSDGGTRVTVVETAGAVTATAFAGSCAWAPRIAGLARIPLLVLA